MRDEVLVILEEAPKLIIQDVKYEASIKNVLDVEGARSEARWAKEEELVLPKRQSASYSIDVKVT